MDPEERQQAAEQAAASMGPLAQVVSAYYHNLLSRNVPAGLAELLVLDFQTFYLEAEEE